MAKSNKSKSIILRKKVKKASRKIVRKSTSKRRSKTKRTISMLKKVVIDNEADTKKYLVPSTKRVIPKIWELPNRKTFYNWLNSNFKKYHSKPEKSSKLFSFKFNSVSILSSKSFLLCFNPSIVADELALLSLI